MGCKEDNTQSKLIKFLVVDPDKYLASLILKTFQEKVQVERVFTADTALHMLGLNHFDIIVVQLKLPLFSGVELVAKLRKIKPELPIIAHSQRVPDKDYEVFTKFGCPPPIITDKPYDLIIKRCEEYITTVEWLKKVYDIQKKLKQNYNCDGIISQTSNMTKELERLTKIVSSKVPVLIVGESGTGKELIARTIHYSSIRAKKPFITVNCAAVPEGLLESQFFGHEKGAFTGANARIPGKFELANGGTLFLDEIGEMSPALQAKLLRVIEYGEFERVGGTETIRVDVRLITATNRNLEQMVEDGKFRADLFYRINVFPIKLPPLRERIEDIPLLIYYFLLQVCKRNNKLLLTIEPEVIEILKQYPWTGNIRELENTIERAVLLSDGYRLKASDFPPQLDWWEQETVFLSENLSSIRKLADVEREVIQNALDATNGNIALAARCLGISRNTLYRKMEEYELHRDEQE